MKNNWRKYHQNTKDRPPSPLLTEALNYVNKREKALDLGAGALIESKLMLSENFKEVVALDVVPFEELKDPAFTFIKSSFEDYEFPSNNFDLVNANFSLPFNRPETFDTVWRNIRHSLVVGGIFSGQLFGPNDEWNTEKSELTFHTKKEVEKLLEDMNVIKLEEFEKEAPLANGGAKHWHVFAIIAEKLS